MGSSGDLKIAQKQGSRIRRLLNWKTLEAHPRYKPLMRGIFSDLNNQLNFKNITPSPREVAVLQLPPEGVEKQMEDKIPDSSDSDSTPEFDKNLDDDFQDVPPPTTNDKGKGQVGPSLSPAKKRMKQLLSHVEEQPVHKTEVCPAIKQLGKKIQPSQSVHKQSDVAKKKTITHIYVPKRPSSAKSDIPKASESKQQSLRQEISSLRNEVRQKFQDIHKLINNNFKLVLNGMKYNDAVQKATKVKI